VTCGERIYPEFVEPVKGVESKVDKGQRVILELIRKVNPRFSANFGKSVSFAWLKREARICVLYQPVTPKGTATKLPGGRDNCLAHKS
jgi:hypothetical protein